MLDSDSNLPDSIFKYDRTRNPKVSLVERRFERLFVLGYLGQRKIEYVWLCLCDCGTFKAIDQRHLLRGNVRSCGCLLRETSHKKNYTHGHSSIIRNGGKRKSRVYEIWVGVKDRTSNPKNPQFQDYGGRGITICAGFLAFPNFLAIMGEPTTEKHTIDRTDNDKGYWCGQCEECLANHRVLNCQWRTQAEQNRNKRTNHWITINDETLCLTDWSNRAGINSARARIRLSRLGWTPEETFGFKERPKQIPWNKKST